MPIAKERRKARTRHGTSDVRLSSGRSCFRVLNEKRDAPTCEKGGKGNSSGRRNRYLYRSVGVFLITVLIFTELRRLFSHGFLITPDVYTIFPAVPEFNGLSTWITVWNPAHLGTESAWPTGYVILGVLAALGIVGAGLQVVVITAVLLVAAIPTWLLAERNVHQPLVSLLAPALYLLSPVLFIMMFDANINLFFYALIPAIGLLALAACRGNSWRVVAGLGVAIGLSCAFVPFTPIFVLPVLLAILFGTGVSSASSREFLRSAVRLVAALVIAVLLNAPYYLGNLGYFTTQGVAGAAEANLPLVEMTYGWSTPLHIFSLVGAGLYPRYAGFYGDTSQALLVLVPAVAAVSLLRLRDKKSAELRLSMAFLVVLSIGLVLLTAGGWTSVLLQTVPYLLVFNYTSPFYIYLGFAFATLATLAVDDIVTRGAQGTAGDEGHNAATPPVQKRLLPDSKVLWRGFGIAVAVALLAASLAPAGFYLESGDFRVLEAPAAIGFPPQWGATAPASFPAIYEFLRAHGADATTRALILPAPTFSGGESIPGYTVNLFNQNEYTGSVYTGPFFAVSAARQYVTTVLDYLIANRTDLLGIPLGLASVKYVFVDKELNFTGPPRWYRGSLIGAPRAFDTLLNQQRDLRIVYDDALFRVYENEDYRPYVQPYRGVTIVRQGSPAAIPNETVYRWGFGNDEWGAPVPEDQIQSITNITDANNRTIAYVINGTDGGGNVTVRFGGNPPEGNLSSTSSRFENLVYMTTLLAPISDQQYEVQYRMNYSGPADHQGGLVFLFGTDTNMTHLWQTDACCPVPVGNQSYNITVNPVLMDPATSYLGVTVVFPYRFGSGTMARMEVSNLSLVRVLRPPPEDSLAPLLIAQLPATYAPRADAVVLARDLSDSNVASLEASGVPLSSLCIGLCAKEGAATGDQLFLAYDALPFPLRTWSSYRSYDALSGAILHVVGPATADLALAGSSFRTVFIRARGIGTIGLSGSMWNVSPISVANASFQWLDVTLPGPFSDTSVRVQVTGTVDLDALLFSDLAALNGDLAWVGSGGSFVQHNPTEYTGTLPPSAGVLLLAQGYNAAWSLSVGSLSVNPLPAVGWANLFPVHVAGASASGTTFTLTFTRQLGHEVLISFQAGTAVLAAVFGTWPWLQRISDAMRRRWAQLRRRS